MEEQKKRLTKLQAANQEIGKLRANITRQQGCISLNSIKIRELEQKLEESKSVLIYANKEIDRAAGIIGEARAALITIAAVKFPEELFKESPEAGKNDFHSTLHYLQVLLARYGTIG